MNSSESERPHEEKETKIVKDFPNILRSPIKCRDFPEAKPQLSSSKGRKKGKTIIVTATQIEKEIEAKAKLKKENYEEH